MEAKSVQEWLVPLSTALGIASTSVAAWIGVLGYRLKARAEARLAETASAERDIALLKLFTELMTIAHARGSSQLSEKAVEHALERTEGTNVAAILSESVVTFPIGVAAQDAAIAAIATLGKKHEILRDASMRALETLSTFKPDVATQYLHDLRRHLPFGRN